MADPFAVFAGATASKQELLKKFWPELYNCLARTEERANRQVWCAVGGGEHAKARVPAAGRLFRGGPPACREHLDAYGVTDNWPLGAEGGHR